MSSNCSSSVICFLSSLFGYCGAALGIVIEFVIPTGIDSFFIMTLYRDGSYGRVFSEPIVSCIAESSANS